MNKTAHIAVAFTTAMLASIAAHAQSTQVYTWTDENGVVHYVDTPPDNPNAVSIEATEAYRPGSAGAYPEADTEAVTDEENPEADEENPEAVESYADQKREQLAARREEARVEEAERQRTCAEARTRVDQLEPSRRVYYTDEQGETVRMDDEERVRLVEEAKAVMAENCD